jgi:hypothetical protein
VHETGQISDAKTLADRLVIYDVLVRHSRGVDRGDAAVLKSAYWPAKWQGAPFEGLARGTRDANDPIYVHLGG